MPLPPDVAQALSRFSVEHALDAVLWLNDEGRIDYANQSASRILGLSAESLTARTFFEIAPEMNPGLWKELWKELRARGTFAFEFTFQGAEKHASQVEITVYRFEKEPRDYACLFFRDIEERQRLKTMEREFVSTVSHELRTPLTVIREGVAQVLDRLRGDINDQQERSLSIALSGIDRLARMIGDLLDLSKIEAGKGVMRQERMDLTLLTREVAAAFQTTAKDRGFHFNVNAPDEPVYIFADRDRLTQVLTNLFSNAFKFTEKGFVRVDVTVQPKTVSCAVTDSGIGLSRDDLKRIFGKFEQLERLSVTGERGTGLGLSICKAILEAHKGRIQAESQGAGFGSTFLIELPRQDARAVFVEKTAALMREVSVRGGSLSAIIYDVANSQASPAGDAQIAAALETLDDVVHEHQGRKPGLILKDAHTLYLAFESTVRKEAERMAAQIQKTAMEALSDGPSGGALTLRYAILSFPDDETGPGPLSQPH